MQLPWPLRDELHARRLARARDGDGEAFRALYRDLYPEVVRFVARRIHGRADAEDLTARVFVAFVERLGDYDRARGSVRGWLLTFARNAVIDHLRKVRPATSPDLLDLLPSDAEGPEGGLLQREELAQLAALVRDLPAETRELLALRFADGLRHREIADVLGLQEATVKQRVSRALRDLRARLRPAAGKKGAEGALA
ncbi:RNA polymerase sigma factor [Nannocystis radixulma]|uniref:Sigma-70 family RNA polymerase sigma factor n=1 Tax=Nannocystis radixulma TaxID=2995305 RepID=A0ABT5AWJ3_9BACT|nr:sigma-70 family RNA polymerase sigma factor [Nannocystis radixulma]MDC0666210.1 sigma-70 family RNA polymerase sigma factor [Nannocystis radixulma]